MVFHWSLSDSKSPLVSRKLLSILADHNNAVVWMVFSRPVISNSSSPCINPLLTVLSAPFATGFTVTFIFQIFYYIYIYIYIYGKDCRRTSKRKVNIL